MGYGKTYKTKWLEDLSGNQGTANQVLISTSAGIAWATASTVIGGPYLPLSGGTMTGNTTHGDNVRSLYGASGDMQIYHDGSNSYVRDVGTGRLWIDSNGEGVSIISDGSSSTPMANFYKDGAVELYHNNVRRFRTNDLGGVSIDHTSGSMGNSFFGAVSGATNGFQIANSSSNEMTYTFQNGSNSQVLKILNNGNVGIGTTSPTTKLNVSGNIAVSSGSYLSFIDSNLSYNKIGRNTSAGGIQITTGGIATMNLLDNSNVGIGTTTPSEKLHVKGNILVEDNDSTDTVAQIGNSGDDGWLNLYANGTSKAFIGSNAVSYFNGGNVGIGTTSPDYQLEVEKTSAQATIGITGGATDARLHLKTNNGDWMLQNDYSNNGALSFYNSGHRLVVAKNGNVGIGTTSPSTKLEIVSAANEEGISIVDSSNNVKYKVRQFTGYAYSSFYNASNTEQVRINSNGTSWFNGGNVGIGTTNPSEKLEVNGNVKVTEGNLTLNKAVNPYLLLNDTNGGAAIFQQSGNDTRIGSDSNTQVQFIQNNAVAVTISTSKNLGIGTTSPITKLHIDEAGTSLPALYMETARYGISVIGDGTSNSQYLLNLQSNGGSTDVMRVQSSGNVGIGTTTPNASALLDVSSTTKGVLLPRMNTTQINAISSPAEGLTVYNTLLSTLCFFNGVSWQKVTSTAM